MKERLKLCYEFMQGSLHYYIFALICMASAIAIEMLTPLFLSFIVDSVLGGEVSQLPGWLQRFMFSFGDREWYLNNLWVLGIMLVAINLFGGLFLYLRGYLSARASENIAKTMRDRLYNHLQRWPYRSHVMAETGDLIQRCSSDVETTRRFLSGQMIEITRAVFIVILSLSVLIPIHAPLTLAAVILLPLIIWFSAFFFKKVTVAFREVDEAEGLLTAMMQENLTGVRVVRAFGRQRHEMDRFEGQNQSFRDLVIDMLKINGSFWASSDVICGLQIILAVGAAAYVAAQGELTAGAFLIFAMYSRRLVWPIRQLGRIISDMGRTFVAIDRIGEVLHSDVEDYDEEKSTPPIDGDIVFDDVCFGYEEDQVVLDHVSFTVPAGKTVAILGATGSGKSSMMLLMQRLYDVDSGKITIGGIDIRDISKKHLRERVGIVLQEPFLYSRSIQDNIGIAKPNSDPELIYRVASTAHAHNFINRFEKGYSTIVGERGVTLSGGQKQRVAIARTLLKDNDILIFDDSLSAVDTETDAAIRHELKTLRKDVTTFIISHRLTTLQEADYILVFEKGKVTQSGTHEELINQEGLYQRIYRIQSSLEDEVEEEMRA